MQFQKKDIFTRRERDGRIAIWLHEDWLIENIKGLTALNLRRKFRPKYTATLRTARQKNAKISPDTGGVYRFTKTKEGIYYDYDRLPKVRQDRLPKREEILPLYEQAMTEKSKKAIATNLIDFVSDTSPWFKSYSDCSDIQANHLATACAVVQYAATEIASREPTSSNAYYRELSEVIKAKNWLYLPKNYRRLKEKIMQVVEGAAVTDVIVLPRKGLQNRAPYDDKQVISWMMYLRSRPENYGNAHIARRIIKMCQIARKKPPSFSWLEHYFSNQKTKWLTGAARHRSNGKGWEYKDYIPVAGALYAGDCWQMDGTRVNFIPHKSEDGKERSLMIIAIRDVHSGDIVGFHLDTKEDRYGYIHALNMAVRATGHVPFELVHDRFPGHNTDEWTLITKKLLRKGVKVSVTSTGSGKAHVERCFATMQDVFMQDFDVYYGQGIRSTREAARRSSEFLTSAKKRARKAGWGFDEAWQAAAAVVDAYRTTPLSEYSRKNANVDESPKQLYEISETPNVYTIDEFERIEFFGTMRSATVRNNGMIRMQIHKAEYIYRITDYEIIKNYKRVSLYYDLEDLSKVYIFAPSSDINSTFLCEVAEEKAVQYYGKEADFEKLAKMKAERKRVAERRNKELEEMTYGAADDLALLMPQATNKVEVDNSETRYLLQNMDVWKDKGEERRINLPEPTVIFDEDEDDGELEVVRRY